MSYSWGIIGHEMQLKTLEKGLSSNDLTHAYFFHGPTAVGKFSVAQVFGKMLLCENGLCLSCKSCLSFEAGVNPDFLLLADDHKSIKIDDVRALVAKTHLTSQGERRVVLIENIERMMHEAQNAFLKTLEEPAGKTIFIITSSHKRKVLETILSRVRQQEFFLLPESIMKADLKTRYPSSSDLEEVMKMAQGRPGLAIDLLATPSKLNEYRDAFHQVERFLSKNAILDKFIYVEFLDKNETAFNLFFDVFSLTLRKALNDLQLNEAQVFEGRFDLKGITELFEKLLETRYLTIRNVNKKLALENFFLATEK